MDPANDDCILKRLPNSPYWRFFEVSYRRRRGTLEARSRHLRRGSREGRRSSGGAIVVGDSPYNIEAVAKLGLRTIAVRSGGFDDRTLSKAGAVAIHNNPADLLARYDSSPLAAA